MSNAYQREELGNYNSTVCFKAVVTGMEDVLGAQATAIALRSAGRKRGVELALSLGLSKGSGSLNDLAGLATKLNDAVGLNGTRLCAVDKIDVDGDVIRVYTRETVCSAGEPMGSKRVCTFTLGAIHGAVEHLLNVNLTPKHTGSVLRGDTHDVFELTPR